MYDARISVANGAHFSLLSLLKTKVMSCDSRVLFTKCSYGQLSCGGLKHGYFPRVLEKWLATYKESGPGSVVGIATGYKLDGPGIRSRWGDKIFRTCPDRPWGPPSLLYNGYRVFPRGKEQPAHDADPSPPSSAMVMKE